MKIEKFIQESLEYILFLESAENRIEFIKKQYPKISDEDIKELNDIDPTKNKKYLNWLTREYNKNSNILNKWQIIKKALEIYNNPEFIKTLTPKNRNIMNLSFDKLQWLINRISESEQDKYMKKEERKSKEELEKEAYIGDSEDYKIYKLNNYEESKWLGQGTKWCTAANSEAGEEDFDSYNKRGPLFIFINKKDPSDKYQLNINIKNSYILLMDKLDENLFDLDTEHLGAINKSHNVSDILKQFNSSNIDEYYKKKLQEYFSDLLQILLKNIKTNDLEYTDEFFILYKNNNIIPLLNKKNIDLLKQIINEYIYKNKNKINSSVINIIKNEYKNLIEDKDTLNDLNNKVNNKIIEDEKFHNTLSKYFNKIKSDYYEKILNNKDDNIDLFDNTEFKELIKYKNIDTPIYHKSKKEIIETHESLDFNDLIISISKKLNNYNLKNFFKELTKLKNIIYKFIKKPKNIDMIKTLYENYIKNILNTELVNKLNEVNFIIEISFIENNVLQINNLQKDNDITDIIIENHIKSLILHNIKFKQLIEQYFKLNNEEIKERLEFFVLLFEHYLNESKISINKNYLEQIINRISNNKKLIIKNIDLDNLILNSNSEINLIDCNIKNFKYNHINNLILNNSNINDKHKLIIEDEIDNLTIENNDNIEDIIIEAKYINKLDIINISNLININIKNKVNTMKLSKIKMSADEEHALYKKFDTYKEQGKLNEISWTYY